MAKGIDWDEIREMYENTDIPVREIARRHDISHGAIQRRAKKENWHRIDVDAVVSDKALVGKGGVLGPIAIRKINELKKELGENYSSLDEPMIAAFALNYEKWIMTQKIIQEEGSVVMSSKGSLYISPYENLAKMYENTFMKAASQLGLSIASRKRVGISTKSDTEGASLFDIDLDDYEDVEV